MIDIVSMVCYGIFFVSLALILIFGLGIIYNNKKKNKKNRNFEDDYYYEED